jgi:hypothetical protein
MRRVCGLAEEKPGLKLQSSWRLSGISRRIKFLAAGAGRMAGMNAPAGSPAASRTAPSARSEVSCAALRKVLPATRCSGSPKTPRPTSATASRPTASARWSWRCPKPKPQVQAVLKACHALDVPVVARGAGTGLSGGAMPNAMGVTLSLAKFNRILKLDAASRTAVVQCGVRNLAISEAAAPLRPVLRARSFQPDRLHHRRQRGRELGRRALPEVRPDAAQRAEGARLHGVEGEVRGVRRRRARCARLRPAERSWWAAKACWP